MRTIEETLKDANSLVSKIYENMSTVETCEAIREKIKTMKICYTGEDNQILVLDKVLDDEQMKQTSVIITALIDKKRDEAARYLDLLNGKVPAMPNPVPEAAVPEIVESANADKTKTVSEKLSVKLVQDMLNEGCTQAFIAKTLGVSAGTLCQFVKTNNLVKSDKHKAPNEGTGVDPKEVQKLIDKGYDDASIGEKLGISRSRVVNIVKENNLVRKPNKKVVPMNYHELCELLEKKIPEIKAMYTNGPFNLKQLADEFHCDSKEDLHRFLSDHGLLKKPKNDPFGGK